MANAFTTVKELAQSGFIFRITDNGGETLDRITVYFCDGDYLGLSENGLGFSMWGEGDWVQRAQEVVDEGSQIDLSLGDLMPELRNHILRRVNEGWADYLALIEARNPNAVAPSRDAAEANEGLHDSAGKGIYSAGDSYCIRLDGDDAADDRGPFKTAAEALRNTLPDAYALSGPEYHSTVDVGSLKKSPAITVAKA